MGGQVISVKTIVRAACLLVSLGCLSAAGWALESDDDHDYPLDSRQTPLGLVWTNDEGMTLYTHTRDRPSTSHCTGPCSEQWPPLVAESRHRQFPPQGFSVITRPDGRLQWAYEHRPLYLFVGDEEPGDITGHGRNDRWWIATP